MRHPLFLPITLLIVSCSSPGGDPGTNTDPGSTVTAPPSSANTADDRDRTMKPEVLIGMMSDDLTGVTVADLFAGDGYFTFKLIAAGANVIAIVNDEAEAEGINARKRELGLGDDRLKVRAVPVGDPGLAPEEADMALIVHHFTLIKDRTNYFKLMRNGLRFPRPLFMVEWQYREMQQGPPLSQRLPSEKIMDMVGAMGYSDVGAHSDKIPDHVVFAINDYYDPYGDPATEGQ
ncbi:MAG: hypothetical protein IPP83_04760 [Flavobacteriales bacterium]|nr:hypothetical protein [Flavobacteriales bacterium]